MKEVKEPKSAKLKEVYGERTVEIQRKIYREWATEYDQQSTQEFGYIGFETGAQEFARRVSDKHARILDAGCGTGLSGKALAGQGFDNIHGLDLSPEMLEIARETGVYQSLGEIDLTQAIKNKEPFDAVFSSGVFGFGPPHPEHLGIVMDVLKPGGLAIITVNGKGWDDLNWEEKLPLEIERQSLNLEEQFEIPYLEIEEIRGIMLIFRR